MKKNSTSQTKSGQKTKSTKARGPVQRDSKEVMAELVAKLSGRLEQKNADEKAADGKPKGTPAPNRDRLTVGGGLGRPRVQRAARPHRDATRAKGATVVNT